MYFRNVKRFTFFYMTICNISIFIDIEWQKLTSVVNKEYNLRWHLTPKTSELAS